MAATNSAPTVGMHHSSMLPGLDFVFFNRRTDGFGRDVLDEAQLDGFARQHPQRPMVVPSGTSTARDGDQMGLLRRP